MSPTLVEFGIYKKGVKKFILRTILRKLALLCMNHTAYPGVSCCCCSSEDWIGDQVLPKLDLFVNLVHYLQNLVMNLFGKNL